jgi:hypothetical protein
MAAALAHRSWVPRHADDRVNTVAEVVAASTPTSVLAELDRLVAETIASMTSTRSTSIRPRTS